MGSHRWLGLYKSTRAKSWQKNILESAPNTQGQESIEVTHPNLHQTSQGHECGSNTPDCTPDPKTKQPFCLCLLTQSHPCARTHFKSGFSCPEVTELLQPEPCAPNWQPLGFPEQCLGIKNKSPMHRARAPAGHLALQDPEH